MSKYARRPFKAIIDDQELNVYVDVICGRFDMPEANSMAGCLAPTAEYGCRMCSVHRSELGDMSISPVTLFKQQRQLGPMQNVRTIASNAGTQAERKRILAEKGLGADPSPFERVGLPLDPYRQFPVDPSHAIASGVVKDRFLVPLVEKILSDKAVDAISLAMNKGAKGGFVMPATYSSVRSIGHVQSYTQHEAVAMVSVLPLVLHTVLPNVKNNGMKSTALKALGKTKDQALSQVIATSVAVSKHIAVALQRDFTEEMYALVDLTARESREQSAALFKPFKLDYAFPNMHTGLHLAASARALGNLMNASCAMDEMIHRIAKSTMPHTNNRDVERSFLHTDNLGQALRLVMVNRCPDDPEDWSSALHRLREACPLLFQGYYYDNIVHGDAGPKGQHGFPVKAIEERFFDIALYKPLRRTEVLQNRFVVHLSQASQDGNSATGLRALAEAVKAAYSLFYGIDSVDFRGDSGRIVNYKKLRMYDNILHQRVTIRTGSFVHMNTGIGETTLCRIRAIFAHTWHRTRHVFLSVDWLQRKDPQPRHLGDVERLTFARKYAYGEVFALGTLSSKKPPHLIPTQSGQTLDLATDFYHNKSVLRLI